MGATDTQIRRSPLMGLAEAARAAGGELRGAAVDIAGVAIDSRGVAAGDLFVAIPGPRFDGHDFVAEAAHRGAAAAITSRPVATDPPLPQVLVADTRLALGRLAAHWRGRFVLPLVALTGSNGKTTTKEMLAAILAAHCGGRGAVLATEGNLNNDIGVPLTLMRLRERHRYAVVEMGMNHLGEIDYLTRMAQPTVAIVLNAHRAHVGLLGSLEAVAQAKGEVYGGLGPAGIALVNADDAFAAYWRNLNAGRRVLGFGTAEGADVRGTLAGAQLRIVTPGDAFAVTLQLAGEHNARNAIAACAAAHALEIPPHAIQAGLAAFAGVPGRLERRAGPGGITVIDDSYNANPESMKAALRVLAQSAGPTLFVMGDMGELGEAAASLHAEVGAFARGLGIGGLLALGPASLHAAEAFGEGAAHFADPEALVAAARERLEHGSTVLVKGSRFMRMERVVARLAPGGEHHAA